MNQPSGRTATIPPPPVTGPTSATSAPMRSMRPDVGMTAQDLDPLTSHPPAAPAGRTALAAGAVIGAGLLLCGIGLVFGGGSRGDNTPNRDGSAGVPAAAAPRGRDIRLGTPPTAPSASPAAAASATLPTH